ncbi:hypothetical protein CC85DRAFT_285587 [Cutaneotrichosporon oleaginosum]|uniref:Uncharacterized protein n=1 Tax=Cutaneotrichosporon oleaginosum TaxID=879819 RepID=A0A0J0XMM9_9TREE|nr:uncharacterized protein CC85DRAFT_285587 [Cutaneotrichosporon oleaginosum]KLT42347.1 hypothetical protein CC85DRAFT_285587 [Cutaneotrichosporon oleaginosum]TXT04167.1 hypothetical protein COLE_07864 [Cutaneotrichosporon oleaginosum]
MSTPTLWPYPEDVPHLLVPHLPYPTLTRLTRVNTLLNMLLTPYLYHTMIIDDRHRGLRLRRALQSPGAIHTRVLYIDAQHSCDECHAAGPPNLPNLSRVVLTFDRGVSLTKPDGVWPDDPCRTLSRARPETLVVRVRNHFVDAVYPALRHHMRRKVYENADVVVSTLVTSRQDIQPAQRGWQGHATQILLPAPDIEAALAWRRLRCLAEHAGSGEHTLTLVGLEAYGVPNEVLEEEERVYEKGRLEASIVKESEPPPVVEDEGESEHAFRGEVARSARERARKQGHDPGQVEAEVKQCLGGLRLVRMTEYLRGRDWEGEVPPTMALKVMQEP